MRSRCARCLLFFFASQCLAQGGPPLLTDDPDPADAGRWEINIATTYQGSAGLGLFELPHVDANYGWGGNVQLKYESGVAAVSQNGGFKLGWEDSLFGIKLRLLNHGEHGLSLGTYPQLGTRLFSSSDATLAGPTTYGLLPVELKYAMGRLAVDSEIGALWEAKAPGGWMYGVCAGYNVTKDIELLAELHGTYGNPVVFPAGLIAQVGTNAALGEAVAILASLGTTLAVPAGSSDTFLAYAGVQLHL